MNIWYLVFIIIITGILILFLANLFGANRVHLTDVEILDPKINGNVNILHITDLHLYKNMSRLRFNNMKRSIKKSLEHTKADMILLTGDYIDNNSGILMLDELLQLIDGQSNVYAVLGNHDFRQYNFLHIFYPLFYKVEGVKTDLKRLKEVMQSRSVTLLDHNCATLTIRDNIIELIGIDPRSFTSPELAEWTKTDPDSYRLVLSHYPDAIKRLYKNIDLMLSGHTHGGQITLFGWPLITKSRLERKDISGLSQWAEAKLFVSRGAGVSHYMPFRLFCPAEISRIHLKGS